MFGSSQAFGGMTGAQETAGTAKRVKQEEKQNVVPVTVRILDDAAAARTDESAELLIHGSEAGLVHLIGVAEAVVQQAAMLEFQLNDSSSRIKVRHYGSGAGMGEGLAGVTSGRYVSIIGNLRTSPTLHVSAMSLRAVTSADEVSYHMIEVALATLKLRTPSVAGMSGLGLSAGVALTDPSTPAKRMEKGSLISPMKVDAPEQISEPATMQPAPAASTDLRSSILTLLKQEQDKSGEVGLALSSVVGKLAHCKAPADKIKQSLEGLVDEGEIITTIDDEHFAMI